MTSATCARSLESVRRAGRLWWLPAGGIGNGLDDRGWAPILDVDPVLVPALLPELRSRELPAYAACLTKTRSSHESAGTATWRLWVGSTHWSAAENCLCSVLPGLLQRFGSGVVR